MTNGSELAVRNVNAYWALTQILRDVSLHVRPGEILAILGRNGVGKTTLFKSIFNVGPKVEGVISVDGSDIARRSPAFISSRGIGYVPDSGGVFARLTVEQNVLVAVRKRLRRKEAEGIVDEALSYFPALKAHRSQTAGSLSGGEQRMLAIARVLIARPKYILLDEPTEGLHPRTIDEVAEILRRMRDDHGTGVMWVDRRIDLALRLADRYAVMERRQIVASGATETADPAAIADRLAV